MERGGIIVGRGEVLGVAVQQITAEALAFTYVHLHRRKSGVYVRHQGAGTDPATLATGHGMRIPLALVVDTERCIHRVLPRTGEPEDLLRQAFPNAPLNELCTSVWITASASGLSMARRAMVVELLERFHIAGFRIVRLHIGPWGLLPVRILLGNTAESWTLGGHRFTFSDGMLTGHARPTDGPEADIQLGEDRITAAHATAFAAAWEHLVPAAERHDAPLPEVIEDRREETARYRYEAGLLLVAALFLVLLGGERLAAHQLARSQAVLRTSATTHAYAAEELDSLRSEVQAMEGLAQALGIERESGLARQAAQLAATVPATIHLDRLVEQPLRGPLKEREPLEALMNIVHIGGTCPDAGTLDRWMTTLKGSHAAGDVKLLSYAVDPGTGLPRFELELAP